MDYGLFALGGIFFGCICLVDLGFSFLAMRFPCLWYGKKTLIKSRDYLKDKLDYIEKHLKEGE